MDEWKLIGKLKCQTCDGKRTVVKVEGNIITTMTCQTCRGTGISYKLYMGTPIRNDKDG